jgi:hypothetical protein
MKSSCSPFPTICGASSEANRSTRPELLELMWLVPSESMSWRPQVLRLRAMVVAPSGGVRGAEMASGDGSTVQRDQHTAACSGLRTTKGRLTRERACSDSRPRRFAQLVPEFPERVPRDHHSRRATSAPTRTAKCNSRQQSRSHPRPGRFANDSPMRCGSTG